LGSDKPVFERSLKIINLNTATESKVLRQWALALKGFLLCAIERPGDAQTTVAKFKNANLTWEIQYFAGFIEDYCLRMPDSKK